MIKEKLAFWSVLSTKIGYVFDRYLPFSASHYTLFSGITAGFAVFFAYFHHYYGSIVLFLMAASCDIIDGAVARQRNTASPLGAYIDGVMDRFVDFAVLFSFFFFDIKTIGMSIGAWISIASFVAILPSFNVAYANHRHVVNDDHETLIWRIMNRGEMFILMLLILISSMFSPIVAGYLLCLFVVLSLITIIQTITTTIYYAKSNLH